MRRVPCRPIDPAMEYSRLAPVGEGYAPTITASPISFEEPRPVSSATWQKVSGEYLFSGGTRVSKNYLFSSGKKVSKRYIFSGGTSVSNPYLFAGAKRVSEGYQLPADLASAATVLRKEDDLETIRRAATAPHLQAYEVAGPHSMALERPRGEEQLSVRSAHDRYGE